MGVRLTGQPNPGRWLQLSVFQCRLSALRRAELARRLEEVIHGRDDHVLILDLGPADKVDPRVESLGKARREEVRALLRAPDPGSEVVEIDGCRVGGCHGSKGRWNESLGRAISGVDEEGLPSPPLLISREPRGG